MLGLPHILHQVNLKSSHTTRWCIGIGAIRSHAATAPFFGAKLVVEAWRPKLKSSEANVWYYIVTVCWILMHAKYTSILQYTIYMIIYVCIFDIHIDYHDTRFPYNVHDDAMMPLDVMVHATKNGLEKGMTKTTWQQKEVVLKKKYLSCIHWYCICHL